MYPPRALPVMQGTNGCDRDAPADLCLHPCKRLLGQTCAAVITRPALGDSDPCTGRRQEGRDRPDPEVLVNGGLTQRHRMTQSTQAVRVAHAMALLVEPIGEQHGRFPVDNFA